LHFKKIAIGGVLSFRDTEHAVLVQTPVCIAGVPALCLQVVSVAVSNGVVALLDECVHKYKRPKPQLSESKCDVTTT